MATVNKGRRSNQYRSALHSLRSHRLDNSVKEVDQKEKELHQRKKTKIELEKKDWEDATCSVCMEYPHNAVLLLCSSHDRGCRPYMCATSYRYSNCLEQFKKAYTKVVSPPHVQIHESIANSSITAGMVSSNDNFKVMELACPLCRGKVKGMTVVEPAREYLNAKRRTCTQEECSFMGTYTELKKHVKQVHPCSRPKAVDPKLQEKWRRLECEREHDDVMSTIQSSMPGALVMGDYVLDVNDSSDFDGEATWDFDVDFDNDNFLEMIPLIQEYTQAGNVTFNTRLRRLRTMMSLQRSFRHTAWEELGERFGIPAISAAGNAATTLEAFSEEDNDESLIGRRHPQRSERRRRSSSAATNLAYSSEEENTETLIGRRRRWRSIERRRGSGSSAATTQAASSEEDNNESLISRPNGWRLSPERRRRTGSSAATTLATSSEENNHVFSIGHLHRWSSPTERRRRSGTRAASSDGNESLISRDNR